MYGSAVPAPTFQDVQDAADRIEGRVLRTPVIPAPWLEDETGASVVLKCENLQHTGAYKARGALNAVLTLDDPEPGVFTHSSGNHGSALAWAARQAGIPCTVILPVTAPEVKAEAVRRHGARIVPCGPDEREEAAAAFGEKSGAAFVHPYDDPAVLAGAGTVTLELLEDHPGLDAIVAPVGGGGLAASCAVVAGTLAPAASVIGGEPELADDAARSLATGVRQPRVPSPSTIADALLGGIGEIAFEVLSAAEARIVTVSEDEIRRAWRDTVRESKLVVEPSSAVAVAALRRSEVAGKSVGVIVSGGNTDLSTL